MFENNLSVRERHVSQKLCIEFYLTTKLNCCQFVRPFIYQEADYISSSI